MMPYSEEQHPNYATRIRNLREARGLSIEDAAEKSGLSWNNYCDLESYDDEILMCVSLREVATLGVVLGVTPLELLAPDENAKPTRKISGNELSITILKFINEVQGPVSEFEEQVGWEVTAALDDPDKILEWNVDCLSDVCAAVGVSWLEALPEIEHGEQ